MTNSDVSVSRIGRGFAVLVLILATGWIAVMANRGFGHGDEAFYLWWLAKPHHFDAMIQPFVPPLRALWTMTHNSIALFRLAGLAVLLACSMILARALARYLAPVTSGQGSLLSIIVPLAMLSTYAVWIPMPNYNWLSNVSAALLLSGFLGWWQSRQVDWGNSLLIGVAGAFAFFAKPPFALLAALAACALLLRTAFTVSARVAISRALLSSAASIALILTFIEATVGFSEFVSSLRLGVEILDFGNSPSQLIIKTLAEFFRPPPAVILGLVIVASSSAALFLRLEIRWTLLLGLLAVAATVAFALFAIIGGSEPLGPTGGLGLLMACGALAILIGHYRTGEFQGLYLISLVLFVLPFALSFGTTNPIYYQTSIYLWPWIILAWVSYGVAFPRSGGATMAGVGIALSTLMVWAAWKPYRLAAPLWQQSIPTRIPFTSGDIMMDRQTAFFSMELAALGTRLCIDEETPIVDLSSGGPGTALFLGGIPPVFPWLVPFYATSAETASRVWRRLGEAQRRSVVFIGPFHSNLEESEPALWFNRNRTHYMRGAMLQPIAGFGDFLEVWVPAQKVCT